MDHQDPDRIVDLREARLGDHICVGYDDDRFFRRTATEFFAAGIEASERVGFFAPPPKLAELTAWLSASGIDVNRLASRGQIVLGDVSAAYLPDGAFDPKRRIESFSASIDEALADGFTGFRVIGDVASIMDRQDVRAEWLSYELRADLLAARKPIAALCSFDHRVCPEQVALEAAAVHSYRYGDVAEPPPFRIVAGAGAGLRIEGEIDFGSATSVAKLLLNASEDAAPAIDVSDLAFIDAAGMRALASGAVALLQRHPGVQIRGGSQIFKRMWDLMGLDRFETIAVR